MYRYFHFFNLILIRMLITITHARIESIYAIHVICEETRRDNFL